MIKLQDAELTSILPCYISKSEDVQAISYAYKMGMRRMLEYAALSRVYADIDRQPEKVLDLMALEMQSQYYDESMDVDIKREIIRNTLAWYMKGGTVSTVEELIQIAFGKGKVVEWFNSEGEPGTFYIETSAELSPEGIQKFSDVIAKVKNVRSHITTVKVLREIRQPYYLGVICFWHKRIQADGGNLDV